MNAYNTKQRSDFLMSLAAEIAARDNIDITNPPLDNRAYLYEIAKRGNCHHETARQIWAKFMRHERHKVVSWGGEREGAGRKPTKHIPDARESGTKKVTSKTKKAVKPARG